ncbi:MerR family transcriptional regulator [Halopseudomonas nanhaiensis]|uniref:MerR family transcriptional regulator n=1 Tax=Halopseudomonas nanhaiensis TaxID=2830842 RepID=UPI001CBF15E9|nr:MerR family transcriptional regulator [Halopseudomonas nanhaiensis]UAW97916.1 MerR family transcriptional regulator [Halopseudomonas nanhaiensis]
MSIAAAELLPIREVARLTGVTAVTLRAWERRYGLIQPHRTPKGHRLYTADNVEQIQTIVAWLGRGVAVGQVRELMSRPAAQDSAGDSPWSEWRQSLVNALIAFDSQRADLIYNTAMSGYSVQQSCERLLEPTIAALEQRWTGQFGDELEKAFVCTWLRGRLASRVYQNNCQQHRHALLMVNLSNDSRQPGMWLLAMLLSHGGRHMELLDWCVPAAELTLISERRDLQALILYGSHALTSEQLRRELPSLMQQTNLAVYFAGPASLIHHRELEALGIEPVPEAPCSAYACIVKDLRSA